MFLRPRQYDVLQGRSLLAVAIIVGGAATGVSKLFASDPWVARQAINQVLPLRDPQPQRPSAPMDGATVPRSTLRFVVPESEYAKPSPLVPTGPAEPEPPAAAANASVPLVKKPSVFLVKPRETPAEQRTALTLHSLYGPGEPTLDLRHAGEPMATATAAKQERLPATRAAADPAPTVDPEQNEPADDDRITQKDAEQAGDDNGAATADASLSNDHESIAQRVPVRDLTLSIGGTTDAPSLARRTRAEPVGSRKNDSLRELGDEPLSASAGDHQRAGDEPSDAPLHASASRDRIGPKGDLVLGLGLASPHDRIAPATGKLRTPIERTLNHYWNRPENTQERTHWGMFHAIMVYDKDTQILDGKRRYNAVAWMAGNNPCRNELLFEQDQQGINVKTGIGLQGHQAQLLAVLGLIDVPAAYPIYVGRSKYSVDDVIRREMRACKSGNELTFTLIGLSHYIDTDSVWVADDGQDWDFQKLIHEELSQPVVGAACGGTHRLMGFAHALRRRRAEGKPMEGQWARADQYVNDFIAYTWQLQNRDGSMSTAWFEKSEDNGKIDRKVQTTGHMVEFLVTAVPDDQLQSPEMLRAVSYLVDTLFEERGHEWQIGPKGHALRALAMYYQRVFGRQDPWRPVSVARVGTSRAR